MSDPSVTGLKEENTRLVNDLSFQLKLNNVLENIRNKSTILCQNCKCIENKSVLSQIKDLNNIYIDLKKKRNHISIITNKEDINCGQKSANERKRRRETINEETDRPKKKVSIETSSGDTNPNFSLITEMFRLNDNNISDTSGEELLNFSDIKCEPSFEESFVQTLYPLTESPEQPTTLWTKFCDKYKCNVCNAVFGQRDQLDRHLANDHNFGFKCQLCDFKTDNESLLKSHKESHLKGKPFKCTHEGCDKWFRSLYQMTKHKIIHSSDTCDTPFKCPIDGCGQWFRTSDKLSEHKQTKHAMKNNFLKNSGDRPFNCPGCNKAFRYAGSLKSHKCPKESYILASNQWIDFSDSHSNSDLMDNFYLMEDIPLECEICSELFETESTLTDHKRHVHHIETGLGQTSHFGVTNGTNSESPESNSFNYSSSSLMKTTLQIESPGKRSKRKEYKQKANNPPSSYALFIRDIRSQLVNTKVEFKTLSQTCSQIWKKMPDNEKEKYHRMAAEIRHNMLITGGRAQRVHKKDSKERKRTNYWNFADGMRSTVYKEMKDQLVIEGKSPSMRDVNKELGNRWRQLTDEEKQRYRSKSKSDEEVVVIESEQTHKS